MNSATQKSWKVLFLEPFYGGSHKAMMDKLVDTVQKENISYDLFTLPAKKWHWKARTSALCLFSKINESPTYETIFFSSVLNFCEILGLCPKLSTCKKVVYFHENQLDYPVQNVKERDFQYGYNQILTAVVADIVVFNSNYNMESFLLKINSFLKLIPGEKPKNLAEQLRPKCQVVYVPTAIPSSLSLNVKAALKSDEDVLQIVWAHRWEHDKDPETFFNILYQLQDNQLKFQVCVMGEQFSKIPQVFNEAKKKLGSSFIRHWGFLKSKLEYYELLSSCDVAISTARHEFFGVSMVEAVSLKCLPLCPNRLSYPELFPSSCLYNTPQQLFKRLRQYCKNIHLVKEHYEEAQFNLERFSWSVLKPTYLSLLSANSVPIENS